MSITPTVMMAASGMINGEGIGTNSSTTSKISSTLNDPLIVAYLGVANHPNIANVSGLSTTINSLPSSFATVTSTTNQISSQAGLMAPDVKTFINLHSGAAAFGSASMEYGAALTQFGNKTFSDLGVGVKNFVDTNSSGLTSLVPGLGALAAKAKTDAFGSLGASLDPAALAKGQALMAGDGLKSGMQGLSTGLKNFGNLFDFSKPQELGYKGLVKSLQNQGLADSTGINDRINALGYDPKVIQVVPDSVLKEVLTTVTGSDLQKIVSQTGVSKVGTYETAADLVDPTKTMPPSAVAALGLKAGAGLDGLRSVGNTLTNIGVPLDNVTAAKLLEGVQAKAGGYLSAVNSLVPASVVASIGPMLGTGSSPFGTPTMSDMMGSLSGSHNTDLKTMNTQFNSISGSDTGQQLITALNNMSAALTADNPTNSATAYTALQTAVTNFNNQASGNGALSSALASISDSLSNIKDHLSKELSNFSLSGLSLSSPPAIVVGAGAILAFAAKLHSFGVDTQQLGHSDVLAGAATDGLTGDAIKASLMEGRNVAAMTAAGKTPTSVSNLTQALADANNNNIDMYIENYTSAYSAYVEARAGVVNKPSVSAINDLSDASDALTSAQNKMMDAATSKAAQDKVDAAIAKATANDPGIVPKFVPTKTIKGIPIR